MRPGALPLALAAVAAAAGCAAASTERLRLPPLETVPRVEVERYLGTWYEIAAFPQRFQRGCTATTASYARLPDGDLEVVNRCRDGRPDGPLRTARGRARVVDPASNAKLEVSFFRPFWGDYWIIELDPDYQHAVVGHPGRDYLWILSRGPTLPEETYAGILGRLRRQGYDVSRLVRTVQPGGR